MKIILLLLFGTALCLIAGESESLEFVRVAKPESYTTARSAKLLGAKNQGDASKEYFLFRTIDFYEGTNAPFQVRIWMPTGVSWPGDNRQIIQIQKDQKIVAAKMIGGQPIPEDAWGAVWPDPGSGTDQK